MAQNSDYFDDDTSPNGPVPRSQPERLATIARLRGMQPQDAGAARVLELGCASGQNLIPMALRNRQSKYLGIDASARYIAMARQTAADLGLANVEFRRQGILELGAELGTFDYLIAHDVYSRAPADVRDRLLAICRGHLAPQGLAYVSYKTYPGGHLHDTLRAMMLYDSRDARTAAQQTATARMLLEFLGVSLSTENPFDQFARGELASVVKQSDASLRHNYLEGVNHPAYFSQFMAHASRHSLKQLGDCTLGIRERDDLGPEAEQRLNEVTADPIQKEHYRDIVRNRSTREAVLCHGDVPLYHSPLPELLQGLYLAARIRPLDANVNLNSTGIDRFTTPGGVQVSTAIPLIKSALIYLGAIWPNSISLEDLVVAAEDLVAAARTAVTAAAGGPSATAQDEISRLKENLMLCCTAGIVDLDSRPQSFTTHVTSHPIASPLARWQLEHGDVATNCQHRSVRLEHLDRFLLRLLDGTRDGSQLLEHLAAWTSEGRMTIMEGQLPVKSLERARQIIEIVLPQSLMRLAQNAFLVG